MAKMCEELRAVLMTVITAAVAAGCDPSLAEHPLVATEPLNDGGISPGAGGASGGTAGTVPVGDPGTGGSVGGVGGAPACWAGQLPPEVQPMLPTVPVATACAVDATAAVWSYPGRAWSSDDDRAFIVGRWISCEPGGGFNLGEHAGIEFGANGRWRLLASDGSGELVPVSADQGEATGVYYLLSSGQLDLGGEGMNGGLRISHLAFAAEMNAMRVTADASTTSVALYARVQPGPRNGADNPPSVSDGRCTMIGTWAVPANTPMPTAPALTMAFDEIGNFVGGPQGSDLCTAHTSHGTYRLGPDGFQLVTNVGLGLCSWWFGAGYHATFDEECAHVTLERVWDNCTGGRGTFNTTSTLARLP